ncbi:MAG: class I SAM-dependent methyltransferase [Clostridiales bacterium]|nr:class I SAM-dependent methyltransferase [Clostridiales bacterium]
MPPYQIFAKVYDLFMAETPYKLWTEYIKGMWGKYGLEPELVLDLGCGTGNVCLQLAREGYDMIGIDSSVEMLSEASGKSDAPMLLLCQDIRSFELYGTVDSIICVGDCLNYLTEPEDLKKAFKLCKNYLNPGGLFIFDLNTPHKYESALSENDFCEISENAAYIWQNSYDNEKKINEYLITFFIKNSSGSYDRFEEEHFQIAYEDETVMEYLEDSGFCLLETADGDTCMEPSRKSLRKIFTARA